MSLRKENDANNRKTTSKNKIKSDEGIKRQENFDTLDFDDSEELEAYLSNSISKVTGNKSVMKQEEDYGGWDAGNKRNDKWSMKKKVLVALGTTVGTIAVFCVIFVSYVLMRITYIDETQRAQSDLTPEELAAQATLPPRSEEQIKLDEDVINILLIGEEKIGSGNADGRSDSMMIASLNTKYNTLKLVSIMRDCYVSIPGYRDNKLNAAFAHGGGDLLARTIEQDFGIQLDGYVRVNFAGFRKLIDSLGGVEIELTEVEAQYLNTTNYISDKKQRNVVPGKQIATGTQALGYCRVRKRAAINGENNDFGRTYRQRAVLSQVYSKVKNLNVVDVVSLVNQLLPYVSTNIKKTDILNYAKAILQMGIPEIEQKRIPVDGGYTGQDLYCGASLVLDWEMNNRELQEFIYGNGVGDIITIHPQSVVPVNTYTPSTRTYAPVYTKAPTVVRTPMPTKQPIQTTAPVVEPTEEPKKTKEPVIEEPVETTKPEPEPTTAPVIEPTVAPEVPKPPVVTKEPELPTVPQEEAPGGEDDGTIG